MTLKNKFIKFVKRDFKTKWLANQGDPSAVMSIIDKINPNALIIGFARRFATYKRAHLLFTDLDRLDKIVNNEKFPVQFIFSGKAHPADGAGQGLIKRIIEISRMPQFLGKIIFLEDYNMVVAKRLVTGVDIWLNTPTRPLEASGTSGEKAEMNGGGIKATASTKKPDGLSLTNAHSQTSPNKTNWMPQRYTPCLRTKSYPYTSPKIPRDTRPNGFSTSKAP